MYARKVSMKLKPNAAEQFGQKFEKDVMPMLRKQPGFQDEMTFTTREGREAFAISLWDRKESAEAYAKNAFRDVLKVLEPLTEGDPRVQNCEVCTSTLHKISA